MFYTANTARVHPSSSAFSVLTVIIYDSTNLSELR